MSSTSSSAESAGSSTEGTGEHPTPESTRQPDVRVACSVPELDTPAAEAGPLWTLDATGRQLDANLIRLAPGESVEQHTEHRLDVLLHVVSGDGWVHGTATTEHLQAGTVLWLPRGAARGITAGDSGLSYLTVHQRRPGLWIGTRDETRPTRDGDESA